VSIKTSFAMRPRWRRGLAVKSKLPIALQRWLLNDGSLTARLLVLFNGDLKVEIISQYWGSPRTDEALAMAIAPRARVLIREVILHGGGQACIYARSILPCKSLTGSMRAMRKLDNRPLGAWLFSQPNMRRGPLTVASFQNNVIELPALVQQNHPLWGRRSVFYIEDKPLLVSEIFLEPLFNIITSRQSEVKNES
jgi:chorismate--pyruvate lyase